MEGPVWGSWPAVSKNVLVWYIVLSGFGRPRHTFGDYIHVHIVCVWYFRPQKVFPGLFARCVSAGWLLKVGRVGVAFGVSRNGHSSGLLSRYKPDHSVWAADSYSTSWCNWTLALETMIWRPRIIWRCSHRHERRLIRHQRVIIGFSHFVRWGIHIFLKLTTLWSLFHISNAI